MAKGDDVKDCLACCLALFMFAAAILLVILIVLVLVYGCVDPVEVTVEEASLGRLALPAPPAAGRNGTTSPASLAYNLSLAVSVRNPNWANRVWRTAPLDAELRLAGTPFAVVRLAGAEEELIRPERSAVYRVVAAAESAAVALGSDEQAEFARESGVGLFRLELVVSGELKYQGESYRRSFTVRCPLKLPLSTAPTAVAFARVERTLPPQECVYVN
ncbi:hypothetical protein EJB05_42306, partial [Eragrostis curvula]